jgi:hypothetical protein
MRMRSLALQRANRLELISRIEKAIKTPVLVYFTADAPIAGGRIGDDVTRYIYDHLKLIGEVRRLGLYLYSSGGQMETPWKIVTMVREF